MPQDSHTFRVTGCGAPIVRLRGAQILSLALLAPWDGWGSPRAGGADY